MRERYMVSEFVNVLPGVYFELCVNISISILVLSIILQEHHDFDLYVKGNKSQNKNAGSQFILLRAQHIPRDRSQTPISCL